MRLKVESIEPSSTTQRLISENPLTCVFTPQYIYIRIRATLGKARTVPDRINALVIYGFYSFRINSLIRHVVGWFVKNVTSRLNIDPPGNGDRLVNISPN